MNPSNSPVPYLSNAENAPAYWHQSILWLIHASSEQTGGTYSLMEEFCPKNSGPPPHYHEQDEGFHLIAGEITFLTGEQILKASDGFFVSIPRGTVHSFRVDSEVAHILNFYTPAGFEQTTIELGQLATTRTLPPPGIDKPPAPKQIEALFQRVGMHPIQGSDILRVQPSS